MKNEIGFPDYFLITVALGFCLLIGILGGMIFAEVIVAAAGIELPASGIFSLLWEVF